MQLLEQVQMLLEKKGIDWNEYSDGKKYGRFIYKEQVENGNLALKLGIDKDNILLKQNGDVLTFVNGKL